MKKFAVVFVGLLFLFFLFGCVSNASNQSNVVLNNSVGEVKIVVVPFVEKGDSIKVDYRGTLADGNEFDSSIGKQPLEFVVGSGQMIKGFDKAVLGMKLNDEKNIKIPAKEAYGESNPQLIQAIPLAQLEKAGINAEIGMEIFANNQPVKIVDLNADTAFLDFNNPLAGKALNFWIKIVAIDKK